MFPDDRFLVEERSFPLPMQEHQKMYIKASVEGGKLGRI